LSKLTKNTRSILQEINKYVPSKNKEEIIESRAHHIITSAINILDLIRENYSPEEAEQLEKRFLSSIKGKDPRRFSRSIKKVGGEENE
jgi:uncharacterized protein (UPF0305 family)